MAKSLRAKSHIKAKSARRHAVYQKYVDDREARLSEKLKQDLVDQKIKELNEKGGENATMEIDDINTSDKSKDDKKVSTSGWRDARHHNYKKSKMIKKTKKKGSFTKF